jgi:hypothetical protein
VGVLREALMHYIEVDKGSVRQETKVKSKAEAEAEVL